MNTGRLVAATLTGVYLSMDCSYGWRALGTRDVPANSEVNAVAVDPIPRALIEYLKSLWSEEHRLWQWEVTRAEAAPTPTP